MKKLMALTILFFSLVTYKQSNAQVHINVNIGSQPAWGPVGYDHVDYYYMPDMDVYYNVPQRQFIYLEGNRWAFSSSLPARYRGYDIYNNYKVVVNEPRPYLRADEYRARYGRYRGDRAPRQVIIRDSHDQRYKNNDRENNDHQDNGNGKNRGHGNDKEKDHGNGRGHGKD